MPIAFTLVLGSVVVW